MSQKVPLLRLIYKNKPFLKDFREIYQRHYLSLTRTAKKMLGNGYDVADIIQEVFIDFLDKSNRGEPVKHPGSWLYRVTLNKCVDHLRKNNRFVDSEPSPHLSGDCNQLENIEEKALLARCLASLKPHERELCVLYSEGMGYKEMAEITGIPFSSIGKTLSRTLIKLENKLKQKGYEMHR
ncbi:MAG: sigma-70 family RNA polymerase sigma factor [Bacteroidales bacterium]